jgi:peptide-methionine (R)-S-oxide reductase
MNVTRRQVFVGAGSAAGALAVFGAGGFASPGAAAKGNFPYKLSDAEWRRKLSPAAYRVLRQEGTETPGSSPLLKEHRRGVFACAGCGQAVFASTAKFESGTGWPSFFKALNGRVGETRDTTLGMVRTEVHCAKCGGHLGHVFDDGPRPTGLRYCMNGVAMTFRPMDFKAQKL